MKKIFFSSLLCCSSVVLNAQPVHSSEPDLFTPNSGSVRLSHRTPEGHQMTLYLDLIKDLKKNNMEFIMEKVDKGLELFTDSLSDATKIHVLEIAVSADQEHTFYRYKSHMPESTDVTILDDEVVDVKHEPDTIRVYEHHRKVSAGDTTGYKIVYEILSKDMTQSQSREFTSHMYDQTQSYLEKRKPYMNLMSVASRLGVYWGVGFVSGVNAPIGYHNDMGFLYATSRTYNSYTPFIAYNFKYSLSFVDEVYKGVESHMLEWGIMKSVQAPYHLLYNKYSVEAGIMRVGRFLTRDNGLEGQKYMLGMGINFPVIRNFGVGIDVGHNLSKHNSVSYAGVSFKAFISPAGL